MCGISGILSLNNQKISNEVIKKMNLAMAHRGPDNDSFFEDDNILLGHRRLSIIDLSVEANQPMTDNSGRYVIVYNGEIYNFKSLKNTLQNYNFKTNSDSEVLLAAFIEYKEKCVEYLDGMFAFAIWDKIEKSLFIARDRFGKKPLYYFLDNEKFIFASEIRSILSSGFVKRKISLKGLTDFLRYQTVHAPETIVENVKMLMPGHFMTIKSGKTEIKKYWSVDSVIMDKNIFDSYDTVKKNVNQLLYSSVEKRLISDVPFGAFLSGGIDSSIVVGMMSKISTQKVKTFSVTFAEEEFSEAKYARIISEKFNTEHTEIKLSPTDFLNLLPEALKAMDHPCGDGANTYVVSKVTKESGVTMALSGLGGDEIFAGYDVFKRLSKLNKYKILSKSPEFTKKLFSKTLKKIKPGIGSEKIAEVLKSRKWELENTYPVNRQLFLDDELYKILKIQNITENSNIEIIKNLNTEDFPLLSQVSFAEISTYMQNVLLRDADQMSMASSLEVRVPFLDYKLAEYVFNIPDKFKYPSTPKKLLVDSVGFLPDEVVNRPKMGFSFPWEQWIKNELFEFCKLKIEDLSKQDIFIKTEIINYWKRFLSGDKTVNWAKIWNLVTLQNYISTNNLEF